MRELVDGKIYDTDTAELLFAGPPRWVGTMDGGALYREDRFYRTRKGAFFQVVRYPPAPTLWSRISSGGWTEGFNIYPLTEPDMQRAAYRYGLDCARLGIAAPTEA